MIWSCFIIIFSHHNTLFHIFTLQTVFRVQEDIYHFLKIIFSIGRWLAWSHVPEIKTVGRSWKGGWNITEKVNQDTVCGCIWLWCRMCWSKQLWNHCSNPSHTQSSEVNIPLSLEGGSIQWLTECPDRFQLTEATGSKRNTGSSETAEVDCERFPGTEIKFPQKDSDPFQPGV